MIPLYNTSQIRNLDSFAIKRLQVPGIVLMENAAIGIYQAIIERINKSIVLELFVAKATMAVMVMQLQDIFLTQVLMLK